MKVSPTSWYSARYHKLAFVPWPGGPVDVEITWTLPRKYITVWNPTFDYVSLVAGARESGVPAPQPPPPPPPAVAAAVAAAAAAIPPSPGTCVAAAKLGYPVGTIVVVRTVDIDPGRSLKFARGEVREAGFHELLGREVRDLNVVAFSWREL